MPPRIPRQRRHREVPDVQVRVLTEEELEALLASWSDPTPAPDGCCRTCETLGLTGTFDAPPHP